MTMQGEPACPSDPVPAAAATASRAAAGTRSRLSWRKKLAFSLISCVVCFGLLECVLALCGVKPAYLTNDPCFGFQPGVPLFVREGALLRTNPAKLTFFNEQGFRAVKSKNTYRIFCLGGSTTYGYPYRDSTSYCGWLRELLRETAPEHNWEVVNCGGVSYASYRECLLLQELVDYQPDLFVIYTGHNEFLEERTYAALRDSSPLLKAARSCVIQTRLGTVASLLFARRAVPSADAQMLSAEVDSALDHSVGPAAYHRDDNHKSLVLEHFRNSVNRMCEIAQAAGAKVILIKPAANLRDFSPFKSEHGTGALDRLAEWTTTFESAREARLNGNTEEAVRLFLAAAELDPQHAQGLWETAAALFDVGRFDEAREYFLRAVDEDICPLRASRPIQAAVQSAAERNGVMLIDFPTLLEQEVEQAHEHRIPGAESFLDQVHPTIDVHLRLAWEIRDQLTTMRLASPVADREEVAERVKEKVLGDIAPRDHALALIQVVRVLGWTGKSDETFRLLDRAEELDPGLSEVANYRGSLFEKLGRPDEARQCYLEAVEKNPEDAMAQTNLGYVELALGQFASARDHFQTALQFISPTASNAFRARLHRGLGTTYARLRLREAAIAELEAAVRLAPGDLAAQQELRSARVPGGDPSPRGTDR